VADWSRAFDDPIPLPDGRRLATLEDAGNYITKLPKAVHEAGEWQAAKEALILVATLAGPTMFARIGFMKALNRDVERVFNSSRKDTHWGRRKLARDRYSITTNQAAIIALFRVMNRYVGNLSPMPGVFPDYPAPVVRNAGTERELVIPPAPRTTRSLVCAT
jgi:hypothetical protein